jgi:hypothetical protein
MESTKNARRINKKELINPISRNPGLISRESNNEKIDGIPGILEWEIPGMKH